MANPQATKAGQKTWRGLVVENECPRKGYNRGDYRSTSSRVLERKIIEREGGRIYSPYTKKVFASRDDTQVEHIVALAEAHDSGLCRANVETKKRFGSDLENLTLASETVNRRKSDKDAGEWLPDHERCWFAGQVVKVKKKYGLSVDERERGRLEEVLTNCKASKK